MEKYLTQKSTQVATVQEEWIGSAIEMEIENDDKKESIFFMAAGECVFN